MTAAAAATARRASRSDRRMGSLADLIDIAALEPDGLIVTRDGTYVRVIDCEFVPNPITADPTQIASIEAGWASLFAAIPDHQGLSLYAQTDPIPIDDAMREDDERVARAIADDLAADPPREDLARTRRRFLQAQRQSVTHRSVGRAARRPGALLGRGALAPRGRDHRALQDRLHAHRRPSTARAGRRTSAPPATACTTPSRSPAC